MTNPFRGEVTLTLNGEPQVMRLTLGALVTLEDAVGPIASLIERFEAGTASPRDVAAVLLAGLKACEWSGDATMLNAASIEGGYLGAVNAAVLLLRRGFGAGQDDN
ncbi:MAG: gene transfer agent family protein [Pseudomonadota bacterium]